MARSRLGDVLVKAGVVDARQVASAQSHVERWGGGRLTRALHELGIVDDGAVADALAAAYRIPRIKLARLPADELALSRLPLSFCESRGVFPVAMGDQNRSLTLAMADPSDLGCVDQAAAMARARIVPGVSGEQEISRAQALHFRGMNLPGHDPKLTPHAMKAAPRADAIPSGGAEFELELEAEPPSRPATAQGMVKEVLAQANVSQWSPEDQARLKVILKHQAQSTQILDALLELLVEKRLMRQSALAAWRKGGALPPLPQLRPPSGTS